jgi:hypothetical protein
LLRDAERLIATWNERQEEDERAQIGSQLADER